MQLILLHVQNEYWGKEIIHVVKYNSNVQTHDALKIDAVKDTFELKSTVPTYISTLQEIKGFIYSLTVR
jgi:hypothetical protein